MAVLGDVELALAEGVPQLDGLITGTGDNLTVIGREGDREDVVGVTKEAAGSAAGVEVPETEGLIPGSGQSKLTVGGDNDILDKVVVAGEGTVGDTVVGLVTGELPDEESLVTGGRDEEVGVLLGGGNGGDPAVVAYKRKRKEIRR